MFCSCSLINSLFSDGSAGYTPGHAPTPSPAWECHQLIKKQRRWEKDLLSCSFQGLQRLRDSSGWKSRNLGGPEYLHSAPRSNVLWLRGRSNASVLARSSQNHETTGVCWCLQLNPGKTSPSQGDILKPKRPGWVIAQSAGAGGQEQLPCWSAQQFRAHNGSAGTWGGIRGLLLYPVNPLPSPNPGNPTLHGASRGVAFTFSNQCWVRKEPWSLQPSSLFFVGFFPPPEAKIDI